MVFCFSGTGNSRYVAAMIAEVLDVGVIDLNELIKSNDNSPILAGQDIIVVCPTYAWRIPKIVSNWLKTTKIMGAKRIWFVMTCGAEVGNASKYNRILAEEMALSYMGTSSIIMPENYIAMFNSPSKEEAEKIVEKATHTILDIITYIKEGIKFKPLRNNLYDRFMSSVVNPCFYRFFVSAKAFKTSDKCIKCGKCIKKCPLNNIVLTNESIKWGKKCTHCMACISYCPVHAIEYGKKTSKKYRYNFEQLDIQNYIDK